MTTKIQFRRGTASEWTAANTLLAEGEMGLELDTGYWKIGNGTDLWNVLDYASPATLTGLLPGAVVFGSATGTAIQNEAGTAGQFLMSYGDIVNGGPHMVDVSIKESIHVATTVHLDATYNNANITEGDYPVIASSLTINTIGHTFIDGLELELDDRVLIKDQNDPIQNGIYVVIQEGEDPGEDPAFPLGQVTIFVRDNDSDTASKIACALAQVQNGLINGGQMFTTYFAESDILGTSPIVYNNIVQTGGTGRAGEFLMSYGGYGVHAPQFVQLNVHEPVLVATSAELVGTYIIGAELNISAISSNSSTWTFTYTGGPFATYTPAVGQQIIISGCTPLAYNGTWTVASASTTQFVITQTGNPGPGTIFGNAIQGDTETDPNVIGDQFYITSSGICYVDIIAVALDDRVLFKNQTNESENGIWICTTAGAAGVSAKFARDNDMNEIAKFPASIVQVIEGDVNAGQSFTTYVNGAGTLGDDPIVWNTMVQAPGTGRAGEFLMSYGGYGLNAPKYIQLNVHEPVTAASKVDYPISTYVKGVMIVPTLITSNSTTWTITYDGSAENIPYPGYTLVAGQLVEIDDITPLAYNGEWTVASVFTAPVTAISASAGTVTYTAVNTFTAGDTVNITGATTAAYNLVNATIASATGLNFTVTSAATGATSTATAVVPKFTITNNSNPGTATVLGDIEQGVIDIDPQIPSDYMILTAAGAMTVDGYQVAFDDRILLKDQASAYQNGIWIVTDDGLSTGTSGHVILARDNDANTADKLAASLVQVIGGPNQAIGSSTNAGTTWQCTLTAGGVFGIGQSNVNFVKLSSNLSASSSVATTYSTTGELNLATLQIPQNYLQVGSTYRIRAMLERTGATTSTDAYFARIGTASTAGTGNILATWTRSAATATVSSVVDWMFTVRSIGTGGTISGGGTNLLTSTTSLTPATGVATAQTVDTTAINYLKISYAQSGANTIAPIFATIEQVV
jgi:hypothetical protein